MKSKILSASLLLACVGLLCISSSHAQDGAPKPLPTLSADAKLPEGAWPGDPTTDITYGYSDKNPIKVGDTGTNSLPEAQRRYLDSLMDKDGNPVSYERLFSGGRNPDGHISDCYEVTLKDGTKTRLWICMYYPHKAPEFQLAPVGFHRVDPAPGKGPRWGLLGEDAGLERSFAEAHNVLSFIIDQSRLEKVKPPFAEVVHSATVVSVFKGTLKPLDKIEIAFPTDSLPMEEDKRKEFIEQAEKKNIGYVRIAFLGEGKGNRYDTEWVNLADYDDGMLGYIRYLSSRLPGTTEKPEH